VAPRRLDDGGRGPGDQQRLPRPDRQGHEVVDGLAARCRGVGRIEGDAAAVEGDAARGAARATGPDRQARARVLRAVQPDRVATLRPHLVLVLHGIGADEAALSLSVGWPRVAVGIAPAVDAEQLAQTRDEEAKPVGDPFHGLVATVPPDRQARTLELPRHSGYRLCAHHDLGVQRTTTFGRPLAKSANSCRIAAAACGSETCHSRTAPGGSAATWSWACSTNCFIFACISGEPGRKASSLQSFLTSRYTSTPSRTTMPS